MQWLDDLMRMLTLVRSGGKHGGLNRENRKNLTAEPNFDYNFNNLEVAPVTN
jgi:hypothetical protein